MEKKVIAIAGNPNVGKSTIFNALTGMKQHTGNWPGKTVAKSEGTFLYNNQEYLLVDLPGTYSLFTHSVEEEIARDFICFESEGVILVVCDATCLERNLNLVLQIMEISSNIVVCVNLLDEAKKKHISIDLKKLELILGVPVIGTCARNNIGIDQLLKAIENSFYECKNPTRIVYPDVIEQAKHTIEYYMPDIELPSKYWLSLRLLEPVTYYSQNLKSYIDELLHQPNIKKAQEEAKQMLTAQDINSQCLEDIIINTVITKSEEIASKTVKLNENEVYYKDHKIDKFLTNKITGIPIMILLLGFIFWITISGANIPSSIISNILFKIEDWLAILLNNLNVSNWIIDMLVHGIYKVLAWVVSVMLPPMAIFFPMFTLLEDLGYLPRIAFNLDYYFKKACTCGKQALTMCMGFGCNAVGVTGCRIIDSPREQLIAILTNNFVPCNGRFPTLIAIITMFFIGTKNNFKNSILSTLLLVCVVIFGIILTFISSKILSQTILKGIPSSFTLELPPYRKPQIGKIIIRSIFDRTIFVLGRAILIAAPTGLIIWLLANINIGNTSILLHCSQFLDPFGKLIGMDGVILLSFILGFPANEIVVPIMIMTYMATGNLMDMETAKLHLLLIENNWSWLTALCTILFCLLHWPCSTTCLTIKKETQSLKWTLIAFFLPTIFGIIICFLVANIVRLIGII